MAPYMTPEWTAVRPFAHERHRTAVAGIGSPRHSGHPPPELSSVADGTPAAKGAIPVGDVVVYQMLFLAAMQSVQGIVSLLPETAAIREGIDSIRKDGELWFLELNPNGQWAWLDENNGRGLVSMVADAIKREDAAHRAHPFRRGPPPRFRAV